MKDLFEDKFDEPVGHRIKYLSFLYSEKKGIKEPIFAWMKTSNLVWHRFFIDAWLPHWHSTNIEESKEYYDTKDIELYIDEEFEEYVDDNDISWKKVNVLEKFNFINKKIIKAESKYFELNEAWCTQLKIDIEDGNEIILNDFFDKKESELIINGTKI